MVNATSFLVKAGASMNQKDINGETCLDIAYKIRSLDILQVLIKNGVTLNTNSERARQLLFLCCEKSHQPLMNSL
jgi:ankyrin repeat protein